MNRPLDPAKDDAELEAEALAPRRRRMWRPSLGQVTLLMFLVIVTLPLAGLFFFRIIENQLIRSTESELIAQSAVLAQAFARLAQEAGPDFSPGARVPEEAVQGSDGLAPILPSLDLASSNILPARPDGQPATPLSAAERQVGDAMTELGMDVQMTTLAGFRFLNAEGTVIGGRHEVGLNFAHVDEVRIALAGIYASTLRLRIRETPAPPLYSISRGTGLRVFTAFPVRVDGFVVGVVYASRTPNNIVRFFYTQQDQVILTTLIVFAVLLLLAAFFIRLINIPVIELIRWTEQVSAGRSARMRPVIHYSTEEIAQLADSFGDMAATLRRRSDYIASFAAHVSHELKSPLTTIQGAAELIGDEDMGPDERKHLVEAIIRDTERLTQLLNRLRELARTEMVSVTGAVTLGEIAPVLREAYPQLTFTFGGDTDVRMAVSSENLIIMLRHLVDNAREQGADGIGLTATAGKTVTLDIRDNGPGISPGNRTRIFDAFFTTKRDSGGTGMGLEIVKSLLETHRGKIDLMPPPNASEARTGFKGAHFRIRLPGVPSSKRR